MNRPIKYRVWDVSLSRYIRLDDLMEYDSPRNFNDYFTMEGLVFQQYVGVEDIDGNSIYDGDIVSYSNLNYEIVWQHCKWDAICPYYCKSNWPRFGSYMESHCRCSTVVGNIFETRDLLKKK